MNFLEVDYQSSTLTVTADKTMAGIVYSDESKVKTLALNVCSFLMGVPGRATEEELNILNEIISGGGLKYVNEIIESKKKNTIWKNYPAFFANYELTAQKCAKLRYIIDSNSYLFIVADSLNLGEDGKTPLLIRKVILKQSNARLNYLLSPGKFNIISGELSKGEVSIATIAQMANTALDREISRRKYSNTIFIPTSSSRVHEVSHSTLQSSLLMRQEENSHLCKSCVIL